MFEINSLSIGALLAFIISYVSYKVKFLTIGGSVGTFIIGAIIFGLGGIIWSVPLLSFFISSSLLTTINPHKNFEVNDYLPKNRSRNFYQVMANGTIPTLIVILNLIWDKPFFIYLYISSIAAVCADTWGTEIGTWNKTATYNILTMKKTNQGESGGISIIGTIGSLSGALIVTVSSLIYIDLKFDYLLFVIISGVAGSLVDSILGASIQVQYLCPKCGKTVDQKKHCNAEIIYYKSGIRIINNDIVNLVAGASGSIFFFIFYLTFNTL